MVSKKSRTAVRENKHRRMRHRLRRHCRETTSGCVQK